MWTSTFYRAFDRFLKYLRVVVFISVLGLLTLGGYYLLIHPEPGKTWEASDLDGENGLKTKITDFKLSEKSGSNDTWTLAAQTVYVTGDSTEMADVKMRFMRPLKQDQATQFELTSQKAVMDNKTKDITFSGNVLVKMPRPVSLHTETLLWSATRRMITSDDVVKLETASSVINGRGLDVSLDKQTFTVRNAVQALFY